MHNIIAKGFLIGLFVISGIVGILHISYRIKLWLRTVRSFDLLCKIGHHVLVTWTAGVAKYDGAIILHSFCIKCTKQFETRVNGQSEWPLEPGNFPFIQKLGDWGVFRPYRGWRRNYT